MIKNTLNEILNSYNFSLFYEKNTTLFLLWIFLAKQIANISKRTFLCITRLIFNVVNAMDILVSSKAETVFVHNRRIVYR